MQSPLKPLSPLKVMTFNLRYLNVHDPSPHTWEERRPVVKACIESESPDLIGTQEGVYEQIKAIDADQPDYNWIGLGRSGGSRGEYTAVFYRPDRLEPLEYDYFWLSDTPNVIGSVTWGHKCQRMVTWVRFRDLSNNQQFYFWNTHFDHDSQSAREKAAELVLQRVQALKTPLPVVLVGDFNAAARRNMSYDILTAPEAFTDTWFSATQRPEEDFATYHGYKSPTPDGAHIDWILTRGPITAQETHIVTFQQNNQYPSDHFPVAATLQLAASTSQ